MKTKSSSLLTKKDKKEILKMVFSIIIGVLLGMASIWVGFTLGDHEKPNGTSYVITYIILLVVLNKSYDKPWLSEDDVFTVAGYVIGVSACMHFFFVLPVQQ